MEENKQPIPKDLEAQLAARLINGIVSAAVIAFGVITVGVAALPAVLARVYGWPWLIAYPCVFAACVLWARCKKR